MAVFNKEPPLVELHDKRTNEIKVSFKFKKVVWRDLQLDFGAQLLNAASDIMGDVCNKEIQEGRATREDIHNWIPVIDDPRPDVEDVIDDLFNVADRNFLLTHPNVYIRNKAKEKFKNNE